MSVPMFDFLKSNHSAVKPINGAAVKDKLSQDKTAVLLDVRSPEEYQSGHIPGSKLLPLPELALRAGELPADKNAPLIVYCLSGARSRTAAGQLTRMGYSNVHDLGGIGNWPYEIRRGR